MQIAIQIVTGLVSPIIFLLMLSKLPLLLTLAFFITAFYFLSKQEKYKTFSINFIVFFSLITLIEAYFAADHGIHKFKRRNDRLHLTILDLLTGKEYKDEKDYFTINYPDIGYGPRPNIEIEAKKIKRSKEVYNVAYTINKHGLRTSSGVEVNPPILFFGGSFTYGEGVNDSETMPYIFTQNSHDKYQAYNFGFHGYGPQQMLGALESGIEKEIIGEKQPKYVVFQTILDHVKRAATAAEVLAWSGYDSSPKFYLDDKGQVQYFGTVKEYVQSLPEAKKNYSPIHKYLINVNKNSKSYFLKYVYAENQIMSRIDNNKVTLTENDLNLYVSIIEKSRDLANEKYNSQFKVVLWDVAHDNHRLQSRRKDPHLIYIEKEFKKRKIDFYRISEIMPDYEKRPYSIRGDGHPTVLAHEKIANFLLREFEE